MKNKPINKMSVIEITQELLENQEKMELIKAKFNRCYRNKDNIRKCCSQDYIENLGDEWNKLQIRNEELNTMEN